MIRQHRGAAQSTANSTQTEMDPYFRGTLWIILILSTLLLSTCDTSCPSSCYCNFEGDVKCTGYYISDVPKELPSNTSRLLLNDTNINILNEQSLSGRDSILRFSLTHSHLHTIHPQAFHVAPQLKSVMLSYNDLSTLPARLFSPLTTLEEIYLNGNQLETIANDMFKGLEGLLLLDLTLNKLNSLAPDVFDGLTNLTTLNMGMNYINKLPPTIFHSLTNLRKLRIYNNKLEVLEEGIFDKLVNLEELSLNKNQIKSLPSQVFWPLENLTILFLSSNQLQALPQQTFYNMPKLNKLTIYNNPLFSLPDELMGHMPYITDFYLYSTNLITVPGNLFANMSGLLRLNLVLNEKLRDLPSDLFCCLPNLQKLSLRNNAIEHFHPQIFSPLSTLRILLLKDNKLKSLPKDIFRNLTGIMTLDLSNNHLKTLPEDIFLSNTYLNSLMLGKNPWDCTCAIRGIARWIRHNERVVLDRNNVECQSPLYQMLRSVVSLHDEEFSYCDASTFKTSFTTNKPTQTMHVTSTSSPGASTTSDPTTLPASLHTESIIQPVETRALSRPFHNTLVLEQGPEFVHHNHHQGWVYVWFLPSSAALTGILMFTYILLLATGLLLIVAAMFGMYRLSVSMDKMRTECI